MAKMRPVKDPLNAPLYEVEQFSQIPQENKDKIFSNFHVLLCKDKFDIGLDDDQEEEERKKKYMRRRKFIMESLNKKYRNFRARLKSDYYDTEETDEDRLKEENMPNFVDKKDWEWLVKYFGSEEFQVINTFNCACLKLEIRILNHPQQLQHLITKEGSIHHPEIQFKFSVHQSSSILHTGQQPPLALLPISCSAALQPCNVAPQPCTAAPKPCTAALYCCPAACIAASLSNEMKRLLEQRKAGEISLTDEEIYAKIKPKGKRNSRDRHTGVSPSITSLFGGFSECEKLRKEADKAMNEAAEAKKEAISANEQNKFSLRSYNLSDFNMDEDFEESNEEYDNEEDKDEEEISGNDRRLE
ncbi:Structural polyprotein [Bienertia sinuspersici]